jgi:hypothetical protein
MVKLHPLLKKWLKKKTADMKKGEWIVRQVEKAKPYKQYVVGTVVDYVYAYDHPEYLHMILKIKGNPKDWGSRWAYKLFYMTTTEDEKRVVNGQRPIVTGGGCFQELARKAKIKRFF